MIELKVLVVDDEPGMRAAVARSLEGLTMTIPLVEGEVVFKVTTGESGEQGLELVESFKPDILLLDYKLPGISGIEVLKALEAQQPDMLTVMITAYATIETAITATKHGAHDFLAKPFTPSELKAVIKKTAKHLLLQRETKRLAEEKQHVRFQFISVLAHELKAPLAAVEGYLYMLRDQALGPELPAYDKVVSRSITRLQGMRKMVLDLLDLTRIESGSKRRELGVVNLAEVANTALETMGPDAKAKNVTLNLECAPYLTMYADRGEVEIIFNNFVSNAVKYNRPDGAVFIRVSREGELLRIDVQDTGIGMNPEEQARLFGEFVRIKNEQTRDIMGSGLGLSIVKKLAALYEGRVELVSEKGKGSTFSIFLKDAPRV